MTRYLFGMIMLLMLVLIISGCGGDNQAVSPSTDSSTVKVTQLPTEGAPVPGHSRDQVQPTQPKNTIISDRISDKGWCTLSSKVIFETFGEPLTEGSIWVYENKSMGHTEKLQFGFSPANQKLMVTQVKWWPAKSGPALQLLPQEYRF